MSAEEIFKRNLDWAYGVTYDLRELHSPEVVDLLNNAADQLFVDTQLLSVGLRAVAAHHEDMGRVVIGNSPHRSRLIVEYCLLIGSVGRFHSIISPTCKFVPSQGQASPQLSIVSLK